MNLKIVTVLILWILVINGQILDGSESHIERTECTRGTYGVNCEQKCPEGCDFNSCNIYTGVCDKGCSINYIPPDCKEKYPWFKSPPKLKSSDFNSIKLKIDLNSENIQGSSNVQSVYYQIAFKIASDESEFQYSEMKDIGELDSVIEITNLRPGMLYTFGAVIVSEDGNYNIEDIKTVDYYTKCLLPRNTDYDVKLLSGTDYINVTWNKLNYENEEVCKITEYLMKLMYYDTNLQKLNYLEEVKCNNNHGYIFKNLLAGEKYAVQVTAITATGQANLTNLLYIYTEPYRYIQIKNIKTKLNKNSSLIITWDVDKMQAYSALNFELKYKIKRHFSCSNKVVINNWISMMVYNQTQKEISYLIPNTQYIIKVDPKIKGYTYNDNANSIFVKTPISKPNLTPVVSENNSWYITNQSAYFSWKINKAECSKLNGLFRGYQIILKDLLEETQEEKSIKDNTVTFDELKPDTKYELQVYVRTNYGYNLEQGLLIPFKTKSNRPVDELIVYKKDLKRKSIGLRWSFNDTDVIDGFIVIVIDEDLNSTNQIIIEPKRCVAWPTFYCTTIDNLIPNNQYTIKIKAKSLDYPTCGSTSSVVTNFNNGFADKPENLRTTNVGPTYISLEWDIPWIHNGVLKSFIVQIEEISSKDIDKCWERKPDVEIPITEELPSYNCKIDDLKPGSTYSIGVLSKTLSYYGLTSKIHVTTLPDSAAIIRTIDHNQEVFKGGNTILRCMLPRSSEDKLFNLVGSRAILTCNVDATAIRHHIKLTWLRGNQLSLSEEHDIIDNMLVLRNVQKSDQGLYNCIGIESDGTVVFSRSITLRVVEPPRIVLNPTRQVVKRGDNAQIICTADGDQPITITWSKLSSRSLPPTVQTSGGYLRFNGITEQDAGRYLCKAANNIGEAESVAEVLVNDNSRDRPAPIIRAIDHNQEVFEGGNTNLRCVLPRSSEQYTVKWSRSRSPLPYDSQLRGDVLSLRNLRLNDTDRYLCKVDSPYGSTTDYIDLRVLRRNSGLYIKPSQGTVYIGDILELECIWTSDTSSSEYNEITWAKVNDDMENNVENQGSFIKFIDVKPENSGTYRCTKRDKNNNIITEDYELTVTPTPSDAASPSVSTKYAPYGKSVVVECNTDLSPPVEYSWAKFGPQMEPIYDRRNLTLYNVTEKSAGLYLCTASNEMVRIDIPTVLVVTGIVPSFRGTDSYLAFPTLLNTYLELNIEVHFKPEMNDGLILYNGQKPGGSGDFFSFGLRDGVPEFRFDVGSGAAIIKATEPVTLNEWHIAKLERVKKHGTMYIDDRGPYRGVSPGTFQGMDLSQLLYIGGVPDFASIQKDAGFQTGFIGCVSGFKSESRTYNLMKDSVDKQGLGTCDVCSNNQCLNQGICQEAQTSQGYTCICQPGYSGEYCDKISEVCTPGICGLGECLNGHDEIECKCKIGTLGKRCERTVEIVEPYFSGKSYLAYPAPTSQQKLTISLKINPASLTDGVILYAAQNHQGIGQFMSVTLKNRQVEFRYTVAGITSMLRSRQNLEIGEWTTISINRNTETQECKLSVNNETPIRSIENGNMHALELKTHLFVGGYDSYKVKIAKSVEVESNFKGCIKMLKVSGMDLDMISSTVDSANTEDCVAARGDACSYNHCKNYATCQTAPKHYEYVCECENGFSGPKCDIEAKLCSTLKPCNNNGICTDIDSNSYRCDCPLGHSGPTCNDKVVLDITANFSGNSYLQLDNSLLDQNKREHSISMTFTTDSANGLLYWQGQEPNNDGVVDNYIAVSIVNGYVELSHRFKGRSTPTIRATDHHVNNNEPHVILIRGNGAEWSLELDRLTTEYGKERDVDIHQLLESTDLIYIGGVPDVILTSNDNHYKGYEGCIGDVRIQDSGYVNLGQKSMSGKNVASCNRHDVNNIIQRNK